MAQKPENLLGEYDQILSGYVALMVYRMSHFCVKADPIALLGIEVDSGDDMLDIEQVCDATLIDDYTYGFIPKDANLIPIIVKAIIEDHPEFKIGYFMCKDDEMCPVTSELEQDPDYIKIVSARVPEVNSDRRNGILDGIKVLYNNCKSQYEKHKIDYGERLGVLVAKKDPTAIKQYKDKFDEVTSQYVEMRDKMYEDKQKEVEEAYNEYMAKHEATQAQELEDAKARGMDVIQGFNMFDNINN